MLTKFTFLLVVGVAMAMASEFKLDRSVQIHQGVHFVPADHIMEFVSLLSHFTGIDFEAVEYDNGYVAGFQCEQFNPSDFNEKYSQYLKPVPIDDQCWIIYG